MAFISFCFENHLSQIAIIKGLQSACYQSFMKCGQLVYQLFMLPKNCHASNNYYVFIFMLQSSLEVSINNIPLN
jgi:uncharacterized protein with WD repeat